MADRRRRTHRIVVMIVVLTLASITTRLTTAQCFHQEIRAPTGQFHAAFGSSVAVSGDAAIVGVRGDNHAGEFSGAAYIFRLDEQFGVWIDQVKLVSPHGAAFDIFGHAVGISGDVAIVGASLDDSNQGDGGAAYIYRFDGPSETWPLEAELTAFDGAPFDLFGESVAIDGDVAVIGAFLHDANGPDSGAVYVYHFDDGTWAWQDKLLASDGSAGAYFGYPVAIDGDVLIAGAYRDSEHGFESGAVYVFRFDPNTQQWIEEAKLTADDAGPLDWFGFSVSINDDLVLVGTPRSHQGDGDFGAAYLFRHDGSDWTQRVRFEAEIAVDGDLFSRSVAIVDDVAIIGAPGDDELALDAGAAYVFTFDAICSTWAQKLKILPDGGDAGDEFGTAAAMDGDVTIIAAPRDDDLVEDAGSAHVYSRIEECDQVTGDVIFLLDGSGSTGQVFQLQLDAIRGCIGALPANGTVTVTVIQFSDSAAVEIPLTLIDSPATTQALQDAVTDIQQIGGGTRMTPGLKLAQTTFMNDALFPFRFLLVSTDARVEDRIQSEARCDFIRSLDPPVRICTALVGEPCPKENEFLKNCANTIDAPTHDPSQLAGQYECVDILGVYGDLCEQCTVPFSNPVLPDTLTVVFGEYMSGAVGDLIDSDDAYVVIGQRPAFNPLLPLIRAEIDGTANSSSATVLDVAIETAVTSIPNQPLQRLSLMNYDCTMWEVIDERTATLADSFATVVFAANPERFLEAGSAVVSMRIELFDPGTVFSPAWGVRIDQVEWGVVP